MRFISASVAAVLLCLAAVAQQQVDLDIGVKGSRPPFFATDSGTANAYVITTMAPLGPTLRTGSMFLFFAANANTGASTLAVDGGSTIAIKKNVSTALASGDITANAIVEVVYDGTNFQCISCGSNSGSSFYQTVQANGSSMAQEGKLNLKSGTNTTVSCADNSGAGSTDCTVNATGASGGLGLFNQVMSATPTSSGTGLTTWFNQGATATVNDGTTGISIFDGTGCGGACNRGRTKTVPSTPYSAIALISYDIPGSGVGWSFGWTDGTKLEIFKMWWNGSVVDFGVYDYSNATSYCCQPIGNSLFTSVQMPNPLWVKASDSGTAITFAVSGNGYRWDTVYSVNKVSGYLGSSGYSHLIFGIDPQGTATGIVLLSYAETSP